MAAKKIGLSRGLDALLSQSAKAKALVEESESESVETLEKSGELTRLPIEFLQRGEYQPRRNMTEEALEELAESIKAQGIIQPIVVRKVKNEKYEIIAGERRWRASQIAGLSEIPCLIKDVPDEAAIAMALIENIQREDLNAIEEAGAIKRLMDEFKLTQQEAAEAVGKSRSTIANLIRLLALEEQCKVMLERGDLEMGHARALLTLPQEKQREIGRIIVAKGLTVRETERLVRDTLNPPQVKAKAAPSADIQRLEKRLVDRLGAKVDLKHGKSGKGKLTISYNNLDELDGILNHLGVAEDN
jgi:ParB family transcriptional regulator, chromosome partitioning protein